MNLVFIVPLHKQHARVHMYRYIITHKFPVPYCAHKVSFPNHKFIHYCGTGISFHIRAKNPRACHYVNNYTCTEF